MRCVEVELSKSEIEKLARHYLNLSRLHFRISDLRKIAYNLTQICFSHSSRRMLSMGKAIGGIYKGAFVAF